jgi:hypothetical protein
VQQTAIQKQVAPASDLLIRPGGTIVVGVQKKAFGKFHASRLRLSYGRTAQVNRSVARFLRGYQLQGGYTPGPLLLLFTLTGLAGSLLLLFRRLTDRTRQLALGCLLFTATAAVVLLSPDAYEFSRRYELPAVVTLVPAGVLGIWAIVSMRKAKKEAAECTVWKVEHLAAELLGSRRPGCPWLRSRRSTALRAASLLGLARDCLGSPLTIPAPCYQALLADRLALIGAGALRDVGEYLFGRPRARAHTRGDAPGQG